MAATPAFAQEQTESGTIVVTGERDRHHVRGPRFVAINVLGFVINQGFVWYLVKHLGGPTWWPTIPMILLTPLLTFALHRRFVYA